MATSPTATPDRLLRGADAPAAARPAPTCAPGNHVERPPRHNGRALDLADIHRLVASDFHQVNALIPHQLTSHVGLVEEIGEHIVTSGGKRLRPLIVLLSARCCGYDGTDHVRLAAIIEFLHTATLLHDDVVDGSARRRGRPTANARWGNAPSHGITTFIVEKVNSSTFPV